MATLTALLLGTDSWLWRAAAISGAAAILLGAFGSHGLRGTVDARAMEVWQTASHYHLAHAGVGLVAALAQRHLAGQLFLGGTLLFSGSLYAMVVTGRRWLGAITPVGGLLLTAGWLALVPRW